MNHNLFKPTDLDGARHMVVGDCNGFTMQERWDAETPLFAKAILSQYFKKQTGENKYHPIILDYGCGVGRLAKEIIKQNDDVFIVGVDASLDMMKQASDYVNDDGFFTQEAQKLDRQFDVAYCVYVLQHCPAIEIREVLARIHSHLKDDGTFIYCSSDYRMSIRFDGQGFFDDRFLGVNLQEEVERYFEYTGELFDRATLDSNNILKTMVEGGLPHPAKVYKKKKLTDYLHISKESEHEKKMKEPAYPNGAVITSGGEIHPTPNAKKLILVNRLAPGDILVMTNALRDLHKSHPGKYLTEVRTPANDIFDNNPFVTKHSYNEEEYRKIESSLSANSGSKVSMGDIDVIDMQYPLIHSSGERGSHFSEGHREFLENVLGIKITQTSLTLEIYLSVAERDWVSPVSVKTGYAGKYWAINAGSKGDFTLKQYPYYQEVVNLFKDRVQFVQIGQKEHNHPALEGVIDLRGQTNLRELFRVIYHAEGVLTCVSLPMHVAAAFRKPCVVVAGAREGTRWELYPNHQFLYVNGCLPCATYDGCWKSRQNDCTNKVGDIAKCMTLLPPDDVMRAIKRYYDGGMLQQ